jgi:plastocyanin
VRRLRLLLAAGALLTVATACGGGSPAASTATTGGTTVNIQDIAFHPPVLTVHAGQTVTWRFNDGGTLHNVTGDGWQSADETSGYYSHTFAAPGTYAYRCTLHPGMNWTVVVTP